MKKLMISFSGGRTSAFMARWCQLNLSNEYEIKYMFANTGLEHEKTLEFVDKCDKEWGLNLAWVEAVVNPEKNKGTKHKLVTFETASRNGDPMRDVIAKYGIPNKAYPHCNRDTKLQPMESYRKSLGWEKSFVAVGIRADEIDRMAKDAEKRNLIYPLCELYPVDKYMILDWWANQDFDLEIPEHYGNCKTCWKKSDRKLKTIAIENPGWFDFFRQMERDFESLYPERIEEKANVFFRKHRRVEDIFIESRQPFEVFKESKRKDQMTFLDPISEEDMADGCEESCEAYGSVA